MKLNRELLEDHGTKLMVLPPSAILSAAKADLSRAVCNAERAKTGEGGYEPYAFHRKHVKGAKTAADLISRAAADLISRAAADPDLGAQSGKYNTRLIYGDADLLREAAKLAATA